MLQSAQASAIVAEHLLEPLSRFYLQDGVEEVVVNRPGEVMTRYNADDRPRGWQAVAVEELTYEHVARKLCTVLANLNGTRFGDDVPILSCQIAPSSNPDRLFRFQAIVGPNVKYRESDTRGLAISVRALRTRQVEFSDYGIGTGTPGADKEALATLVDDPDLLARLERAVLNGLSILVSGPTSSGKTTFLNRLIRVIPADARIISVEDVLELDVPHANRVRLQVNRNAQTNQVGYSQILDAIVRLTPTICICGEISMTNAEAVYGLMGKGHPVYTTIHASSPDEAIEALVNNMAVSKTVLDPARAASMLRTQIGCIVQLSHEPATGRRRVVDVVFPAERGDGCPSVSR